MLRRSRNSKKKPRKGNKKRPRPGTYTKIEARRTEGTGGGTRKRQRAKKDIALTRCPSDFVNTIETIHIEQEIMKRDDGTSTTVERFDFPGK